MEAPKSSKGKKLSKALKFLLPRATGPTAPESSSGTTATTVSTVGPPKSADRLAVEERYAEAANALEQAILENKDRWGDIQFSVSRFAKEPETFDDARFRKSIQDMLAEQKKNYKNRGKWKKLCDIVQNYLYTPAAPFLKNCFEIAKNSSEAKTQNYMCINFPDPSDESLRAAIRGPSGFDAGGSSIDSINGRSQTWKLRGKLRWK
jgi:hypothetical protein